LKKYVIAHDLGTTGNKTCIFALDQSLLLIDSHVAEYPLITLPNGGAEQKVDDWWNAICTGTKTLLERRKISPKEIAGISFSTQLQGSIFVDQAGIALRNPMIWMDSRATAQSDQKIHHGLQVQGYNLKNLLISMKYTGAGAGTAKDPIFKHMWVRENEPDTYNKAFKWLDVKDYLTLQCTGKAAMTYDSANLTWIFDTRPGHLGWSKPMCKIFEMNMELLPNVVKSTDVIGHLTDQAAKDMGLVPGIPVVGGGGDSSCIPIGAGSIGVWDTHIYVGTSGWVVSNSPKRMTDIGNFIGAVMGGIPGLYSYIAEMETAGVCLQWFRDHLALDEIGVYLDAQNVADKNEEYASLYDFLNRMVLETPPGAGNVLFTPWLHGNRAPREDPFVRGMFFNIGLNTGKRQLLRAVLEGMAFNFRWLLDAVEQKAPAQPNVRFVGGGAKSSASCQILADITGKIIETTYEPQNAGAAGAAIICGVGLGMIPNFKSAKDLIPVKEIFYPRAEYRKLYEQNYAVFKQLYENNRKLFRQLNKR
jgi:xylulokinase